MSFSFSLWLGIFSAPGAIRVRTRDLPAFRRYTWDQGYASPS